MKNRTFSIFIVLFLMVVPHGVWADMSVTSAVSSPIQEVESRKAHFESGKTRLTPYSRKILDEAIGYLKQVDESYVIRVAGYSDGHSKKNGTNDDLSLQRAEVVATYLSSNGVDRNRVTTEGLGDTSPIASNTTAKGRLQNRRVEITVIPPDAQMSTEASKNPEPFMAPETLPTPEPLLAQSETQLLNPSSPQEAAVVLAKPTEQIVVAGDPEQPQPESPEIKIDSSNKLEEDETSIQRSIVQIPLEELEDTMLASEKKKNRKYRFNHHVYEDRKRVDQGQTYVQFTPIWMTLDGAKNLGATIDRISSQVSFRGEAGWISFLEDSNQAFISARGYGNFLRFNDNPATLMGSKQKEYTFGGDLGIGRYFHPSFFLQAQVGYGTELLYLSRGGGIDLDFEYIGHIGISSECVVWRFSEDGDIGLNGVFQYYDIGRGVLDSGSGYDLGVFVDYDFLRAGMGFSYLSLKTDTHDFHSWQFGPNLRLYF